MKKANPAEVYAIFLDRKIPRDTEGKPKPVRTRKIDEPEDIAYISDVEKQLDFILKMEQNDPTKLILYARHKDIKITPLKVMLAIMSLERYEKLLSPLGKALLNKFRSIEPGSLLANELMLARSYWTVFDDFKKSKGEQAIADFLKFQLDIEKHIKFLENFQPPISTEAMKQKLHILEYMKNRLEGNLKKFENDETARKVQQKISGPMEQLEALNKSLDLNLAQVRLAESLIEKVQPILDDLEEMLPKLTDITQNRIRSNIEDNKTVIEEINAKIANHRKSLQQPASQQHRTLDLILHEFDTATDQLEPLVDSSLKTLHDSNTKKIIIDNINLLHKYIKELNTLSLSTEQQDIVDRRISGAASTANKLINKLPPKDRPKKITIRALRVTFDLNDDDPRRSRSRSSRGSHGSWTSV